MVDAGNWTAALLAFEAAAGLVTDKDDPRGELLDGAALAAQELRRDDLRSGSSVRGAPMRTFEILVAHQGHSRVREPGTS